MQRLGFSDINGDEALAVCLFRTWNARTQIARNTDTDILDDDRGDFLTDLVRDFCRLLTREKDLIGLGDLLSFTEEQLLNDLSERLITVSSVGGDHLPDLCIRHTRNMVRSGRDELMARIHGSYSQVAIGL